MSAIHSAPNPSAAGVQVDVLVSDPARVTSSAAAMCERACRLGAKATTDGFRCPGCTDPLGCLREAVKLEKESRK